MPYFTFQLNGDSPIIRAGIGVSKLRREALTLAGEDVPDIEPIYGLLDTGCTHMMIDPNVADKLKLQSKGKERVSTANGEVEADEFDISLYIPGPADEMPLYLPNLSATVAQDLFSRQGFHALIGIAALEKCIFFYEGKSRTGTLVW